MDSRARRPPPPTNTMCRMPSPPEACRRFDRGQGVLQDEAAEIDAGEGRRREGVGGRVGIGRGRIDVDPDEAATVDFGADFAGAEVAPRPVAEVEKFGTDSSGVDDGRRIGGEMDHHGGMVAGTAQNRAGS